MVKPKDIFDNEMLTIEEIAAKLGVCKKWVQMRCMRKYTNEPIPYRRIGRRFWFIYDEVKDWNTKRKGL
ncbi:MAG: helix-turn-helix domain-containing protein [Endomicrobium sp.]|nr:helix-turn-helix domain-containing protein [Endomicrobium sp.]